MSNSRIAWIDRLGEGMIPTRDTVMQEGDLLASLQSGHTAGAGIDVHEKEPFVGTDKSQPLAGAPNCINTPHSAFYSEEGFREMRELAAQSAIDALQGRPLQNVVNARLLAGAAPRSAIIEPRD
jgi:phosphoglycerate dehydrogenase-like enzyme